ncbi:hypothetical protein BOTBODRAFT_58433 [Botryobasidium botryosum FD-172 SS1]|uniref:U6 snRNA phosphodiesterase n=1 Tax=Botryobasidium botryosum (strain FD-172 SS1) TaxID=930990 RepID=A0A067M5E2_BOTB1|nr:hypothetical protein BOTBODRAFT_58433 [Botryobasidium botryosum FD-172 SS1]
MAALPSLVQYSSSEDEAEDNVPGGTNLSSKRGASSSASDLSVVHPASALPALPVSFLSHIPTSDPTAHQGRRRLQPHVDGQFAAHVYISVPLNRKTFRILQNALALAKVEVPELYSLLGEGEKCDLHISLSRPIYLRAHQREEFKRAIRTLASESAPFIASFACFTSFTNDERTRTFLSLEIGAGHSELRRLSSALTPHLNFLHQKTYYDQPRFHASIAWALLHSGNDTNGDAFPSIPEFPPDFVEGLEDKMGKDIRAVGSLKVEEVEVKIGKEVKRYSLGGSLS